MSHRLYTFINHIYMSPLQWGIQTAHCVSTLSVKYRNNAQAHAYRDWAELDPTIIVCRGGNVADLQDLHSRISVLAEMLKLPHCAFNEDQKSLGGVMTAVAVLVPDSIFNAYDLGEADLITKGSNPTLHAFLTIIKYAKLA
jgi:hypothetical protein